MKIKMRKYKLSKKRKRYVKDTKGWEDQPEPETHSYFNAGQTEARNEKTKRS